jgi:hypothetical protein
MPKPSNAHAIRVPRTVYSRIKSMRGCGRFTVSARIGLLVAAWDTMTPSEQDQHIKRTEPAHTRLEMSNGAR